MKTTSITLEDLEKTYITLRGKVTALKKIDLHVNKSEFFVLLGPSGCGKSTLLNVIAGLEKPTRGKLIFGDLTVAAPDENIFLSPFERDIAMVFQSYALYPHMTIKQNLEFPLTNLKGDSALSKEDMEKRVMESAELLKITNLLDRKPSELSGGQRQRVAIGRAIVRNPKIFLMDEPLSNLDAQLRTEMRAQLKALQQDLSITTIYVTHDQLEAMTLGDRIAIIDKGYIQQLGTPVEVYEKPINTFIARFIGNPPMNLLKGTYKSGEKDIFELEGEKNHVILDPKTAERLKQFEGKTINIGIRPECIDIVDTDQGNLNVHIGVIENIGAEYLANIFLQDETFIVKTLFHKQGDFALKFPEDKLHIFDPDGVRVD